MTIVSAWTGRRWGVVALLLAAGAALLSARPAAAANDPRPDLAPSLAWVSDGYGSGGYFYTYKITVQNIREYDAESHSVWGGPAYGVVLQYTAPEYTAVQSATATNGFACTYAGRALSCTGGAIDSGKLATITVVLKNVGAPPPGTSWNTFCNMRHTAVVDPANTIRERDETNNTFDVTLFNNWCLN
jgi:hypothetical protein